MNHMCNNCNKIGVTLRCSSCQRVYYCNKKCQKLDWKQKHKKQCTQKYLQSSINNQKNWDRFWKMNEVNEVESSMCLPSWLYNKKRFVRFCAKVNRNIIPQISSLIYCYLTAYKTTFIINNEKIEMYLCQYFENNLRCRVDNIDTVADLMMQHFSDKNNIINKNTNKEYKSSDWIKLREYVISIIRDSRDDTFGDEIAVNITICPPDGFSVPLCIAQFRAEDIMKRFNGNEYFELIKCLLDYYHIPYTKFLSIGLSHSVTNDNQIRKDLLKMLQTKIYDKIKATFDYWSGEIGMKYNTELEYNAAQQRQECLMM